LPRFGVHGTGDDKQDFAILRGDERYLDVEGMGGYKYSEETELMIVRVAIVEWD
jgi:hypothetical protein